ncbi:MAG: hypothetical protein FWE14_12210 [Lachnospiraceae bacterium]|nr:hypothetical protein [Lachnospiraceae bacterium]
MKATDEQKKLLLLLLIAIVVAIPYFFIIRPQMDKSETLRAEIAALSARRDVLEGYLVKMPEYQQELAAMEGRKKEIFSHYPSELPQEATLLFIDKAEKNIPIFMRQVAFSPDVLVEMISPESAEPFIEVMEIASNEPLIQGLDGLNNLTAIAFEGSYASFKSLLRHVAEYENRLVIPNLSVNYRADTALVSGNFTLRQFAMSGEGRERVISVEPVMRLGAPIIFDGRLD